MAEKAKQQDELAESLNELFTNISAMVKGELQGTSNLLELLEKMNLKVAEEYNGYGDVAAGLRVFVEQLKTKNGNFEEYVEQIDTIIQQVGKLEAEVSVLDKYVSLLESKVQSAYHHTSHPNHKKQGWKRTIDEEPEARRQEDVLGAVLVKGDMMEATEYIHYNKGMFVNRKISWRIGNLGASKLGVFDTH